MYSSALNMMFVSGADGQWSGSPRGREHFARLGLTCVPLLHPSTVLTYGDILEFVWCVCVWGGRVSVEGKTEWMEGYGHQLRSGAR